MLTAETDKHGFFEEKGNTLRGWTWAIAVALFVIAMVIWFMSDNMMPMMCAVPTVLALAFIGNNMTRRSIDGNNLVAHCKALRNWLRDFSSLEERPPTDVKVWGEFMVYAYLFGVAKQAIEQLRKDAASAVHGRPDVWRYLRALVGLVYLLRERRECRDARCGKLPFLVVQPGCEDR